MLITYIEGKILNLSISIGAISCLRRVFKLLACCFKGNAHSLKGSLLHCGGEKRKSTILANGVFAYPKPTGTVRNPELLQFKIALPILGRVRFSYGKNTYKSNQFVVCKGGESKPRPFSFYPPIPVNAGRWIMPRGRSYV